VGAAVGADQQRVALRVVARALGAGVHAHQAAVAVLRVAGADALGDDAAAGVAADVDHLGAGVRLLEVVGHGDRVELAAESSPRSITLGYFQVMAEPVSICVQAMRERWPAHRPRLVTKL
jgi:hypothetical protein